MVSEKEKLVLDECWGIWTLPWSRWRLLGILLNSSGSHLKFMVLPVRKVQGLNLADLRNVAVDPRTVQTDEDPQGAGAPVRIFREEQKGTN